MPFRDSYLAISPPELTEEGGTGEACQYAKGTVLDGIADWMIHGVEASMPGVGTPEALYLIGRDMGIDRGPTETDAHYIDRLQRAIDAHRIRGAAPELLRTLAAWFSPSVATPIRLVSNSAVWHTIDLGTGVVTKTVDGTNWTWDAYASTRWWRGWVIIDSTDGPWEADVWGPGLWGDGGTWGSDATVDQIAMLRRWIDRWKPGNIANEAIIVTFDHTLFEVADASPPNPSGNGEDPAWRSTLDAIFWKGPDAS